jgi:DNA-binding NarL/FixJ family response regulator
MGALRARVLVADDSDVFLRVAASVISATSRLRLVGAVGSGQEAIRLLPQLRPDLVVLDFSMPAGLSLRRGGCLRAWTMGLAERRRCGRGLTS